jgi:hypothetical protein
MFRSPDQFSLPIIVHVPSLNVYKIVPVWSPIQFDPSASHPPSGTGGCGGGGTGGVGSGTLPQLVVANGIEVNNPPPIAPIDKAVISLFDIFVFFIFLLMCNFTIISASKKKKKGPCIPEIIYQIKGQIKSL